MIFIKNTTLQKVLFLFSMVALFSAPMLDARLSPKQRGRNRHERIANQYQLKGSEELVYQNKWLIGLAGGGVLALGAASIAIAFFDPALASEDKFVLSICGPICSAAGAWALKDLFRKGPYLIINEEGLRLAGHGLIAWETIASLDSQRIDNAGYLTISLVNGTLITIVDSLLRSSVKDIIRKIGCFKEVTYSSELGVFLLTDHPTLSDEEKFKIELDKCVKEADKFIKEMDDSVYSKAA